MLHFWPSSAWVQTNSQRLGAKAPKHLPRDIQPNCSLDRWRTLHFIWQEVSSFPRCLCDVCRPEFSHCLQILWINGSSFLLGNDAGVGSGGEGLKKYSCPRFLRSGNAVQHEMRLVSLDNDPSHKDDVHTTIKCVYPLIRFICWLLDLLWNTIIKCCYLTYIDSGKVI